MVVVIANVIVIDVGQMITVVGIAIEAAAAIDVAVVAEVLVPDRAVEAIIIAVVEEKDVAVVVDPMIVIVVVVVDEAVVEAAIVTVQDHEVEVVVRVVAVESVV